MRVCCQWFTALTFVLRVNVLWTVKKTTSSIRFLQIHEGNVIHMTKEISLINMLQQPKKGKIEKVEFFKTQDLIQQHSVDPY